MKQHYFYFTLVSCIIITSSFFPVSKSVKQTEPVTIDSAMFTPNTAAGWSIYSYYLNQDTPDSVEFELILQHDNNINWSDEQWIGTVNGNYIPSIEQQQMYYLLANNSWNMRITSDGKCFLKVIQGSAPPQNPVIIPIKIRYKNN